jgi:hypothetical protein
VRQFFRAALCCCEAKSSPFKAQICDVAIEALSLHRSCGLFGRSPFPGSALGGQIACQLKRTFDVLPTTITNLFDKSVILALTSG